MSDIEQIRMKKVKQNVGVTLFVFFLFGVIFSLVGISGFLTSMSVYRMQCAHSAGYCEIAQYSLLENDFVVKNKIQLSNIQHLYLDKKRAKNGNIYRMFLKTNNKQIPIENMYTNIGYNERTTLIHQFKNWKNNQGDNLFTYQESREKGWIMIVFTIIGLGILCLFVKGFLLYRKEKQKREINNPTRSENAIERM